METYEAGISGGVRRVRDRVVGWSRETWDAIRMVDRAKVAAWIGGAALVGMLAVHTWQISSLQVTVAKQTSAISAATATANAAAKAAKIKPMSKARPAR